MKKVPYLHILLFVITFYMKMKNTRIFLKTFIVDDQLGS